MRNSHLTVSFYRFNFFRIYMEINIRNKSTLKIIIIISKKINDFQFELEDFYQP